jgi:hypothetical protein
MNPQSIYPIIISIEIPNPIDKALNHQLSLENIYTDLFRGDLNITDEFVNNSELKKIINQINSFNDLSNEWAGDSTVKPSQKVIDNAIIFLFNLGRYNKKIKAEDITPTPYGTITMNWYNGDKELSIEIGNTSIGFFSELPEYNNPIGDNITFDTQLTPNEILQMFKKIY